MHRRITAWLAILALVASALLPAHAVARGPGMADFCSSMPQKSQPAPAGAHDSSCDQCCGCAGAAAPASDGACAPLEVAASRVAPVHAIPPPRAAPATVLARGPPAVTSSPT